MPEQSLDPASTIEPTTEESTASDPATQPSPSETDPDVEPEPDPASDGEMPLDSELTPTPSNIPWSDVSFTGSDSQGYNYQITIHYSPWILLSNKELVDEAWSEVSKGKELPSYESWGITDLASIRDTIKGNEYLYGGSGNTMSAATKVNDLYYCIGSISIKNNTDGWSITESNPQTILLPIEIKTDESSSDYKGFAASMEFYGDGSYKYLGGLRVASQMKNDTWGPLPFVLMTSELFSPNTPDGAYYSYVLNDLVIRYKKALNALSVSDMPDIRPGVIGKNGEYASPTADLS